MNAIKKQIEFEVLEGSNPTEKTIEYFKQSGFKLVDNNQNDKKIRFERGSIASNMWTFNPLNWKSEIYIEIYGKEVKANFNINSAGQIPTNKDEILWETFINNYQRYLSDSSFDFLTENSKTLKTTKGKNLKYLGWAALGGLIGGLPAGLLAYWTEIDILVAIGAVGGAVGLMTKKINDDKKKNAL